MTQALNLANFANTLDSSGRASNSGLQNASITVTAGTGLTGGGTVALGGSVTLNNAGVTSIIAGTGISISGSSGAVTISATSSSTVALALRLASGGGSAPMTFTYNGNTSAPVYLWGTNGSSLAQNELYTTANILQNMTAYIIGSICLAWNDSYFGSGYTVGSNYTLSGKPGSWRCLDSVYSGSSTHGCCSYAVYISIFVRYA
jgi:hypothetical protein